METEGFRKNAEEIAGEVEKRGGKQKGSPGKIQENLVLEINV